MKTNTKTVDTILTAMGICLPLEPLSRLDMQEYLCQLDHILELAAGERQRLGELLCAAQRITAVQLEDALAQQRSCHRKLGDILIEKKLLTQQERDAILEYQRRQSGVAPPSGKYILGNILVTNGEISRVQLEDALHRQAHSGRRLGVELVAAGHADRKQIDEGLLLQRKIISHALAVSAGMAPLAPAAPAAQPIAAMTVTAVDIAKVQPRTVHLQTDSQTQRTIREAPAARGDALAAAARVSAFTAKPVRTISWRFPRLVGLLHRFRLTG